MRQTAFPSGVEDLAMNLYTILRDTSQIKCFEQDPWMMVCFSFRERTSPRRAFLFLTPPSHIQPRLTCSTALLRATATPLTCG